MRRLDADAVEQAITDAERSTTGEIRVSIAPFFTGDVRQMAERAFDRLGMHATRDRNAVLLLLVPSRRKFAFVGDEGVHQRVGQAFWDELSELLSSQFRAGHHTEGVLAVIERIGARLAEHFPAVPGQEHDELANAVDFGGLAPASSGAGSRS